MSHILLLEMADFHDEVKVGPVWPPDLLEPEQHVALGLVEVVGWVEYNVLDLVLLAVYAVCYCPGFVCRTYQEIQVETEVGYQEQVELEVKEQVEVGRQK